MGHRTLGCLSTARSLPAISQDVSGDLELRWSRFLGFSSTSHLLLQEMGGELSLSVISILSTRC